ncbi:uncharacterized protein LOC135092639 [Scylla paramamosain]|uniref:uncharacterized protein LOC135092639 n=1 Tax=Scylla paramamosain TaxID=85552 RepID=UPI003082C92A
MPRLRGPGAPPRVTVAVAVVVVVMAVVVQGAAGQDATFPSLTDAMLPPDEGPEGSVAGVSLGPGHSLLCSPPLDPLEVTQQPPTTLCAFVRVNVTRQAARLLTLTFPTSTLTVEIDHLGVWLGVAGDGAAPPAVFFFEARFPPGVWRHLCLQHRPAPPQAKCVVDGAREPPSTMSVEDDQGALASRRWSDAGGNGGGQLCVGGGEVEADVAGVALWFQLLQEDVLAGTSGCETPWRGGAPRMSLGSWWLPKGGAAPATFPLRQVCGAAPRLVLVRPAGTFRGHGVVCAALGGAVPSAAVLAPALATTLASHNESCRGPAGLLSWVGGSPVGGTAAEETCPALTAGGAAQAACVRQLPCSVCTVPHAALYRLYGHDGSLFDHTFFLQAEGGRLAFRGAGGSRLERDGDGWRLVSELHGRRWTLADAPVPVGRRLWTEGAAQTVLALTVCRSGQFCCSDGQCVAQTARCDDIVHCRDRSDEADCSVVVRPQGYDPYYPPPPRPGEEPPLDLLYHVDVYSLDDITTEGGSATMNVGMTLMWHDPRIKFLNLKSGVKNYFPCNLVWTPSVRAVSGHGEGTVLQTDDYEKFCFAHANDEKEQRPLSDAFMSHQADGATHAIQNYVGVLASTPCHFQLERYPFDTQKCNISFMLMNAPWTRVFRKTTPGASVEYFDTRRVLLEYELHALTTEVSAFLQGTDNNTYFALTFHLQRLYGYHVTNSYFPSLLMFFISWATFFFQVDDFTNRIMIALTAQLVLAALFTSTTQSSVRTPYLKLIDVWYAAVITFCFVIVISQTVINVVLHASSVPRAALLLVGLRGAALQKGKEIVSPKGLPRGPEGGLQMAAAQRYNRVLRVAVMVVAVLFVGSYSLMALGAI